MACIPQHARVCIIGAGVAGLSAAQKLIQAGVKDVVVLEAQDRIGGRVHTVEHGDHVLELGAHWIHGEEENVVFEWASQNNQVDDEPKLTQTGIGETVFVRENGEIVPAETFEAFELAFANLEEQAEKDFPSFPHSVGQYYSEQFKSLNQWGVIGEELLDWRGRFQNCIDGTDSWYDCSARGHTCYKECPGNIVVNWKNGYRALLNHLKEELPKSCLHLNSAVKTIDWHGPLASSASCNLTLWSGQVIRADHVVFTPSLAVLKAVVEEMFNPPLPVEKSRAIEGLGIGVVDKIFIQFPQQWWETGCDGFSFLYNLEETSETITKENWEYGVLGFYEVYKQPNMLCGWITGPAARMMEQVQEEEVIKRCVSLLRKRLAPKFQIPDAVWGKRSSWGQNPWIKGSYSFRSTKSEAMNVWAADLASPLINADDAPVVCFAGEATHDYFYSTVHGAVETGRREAERLIQYLSRSQGCLEPIVAADTSNQRNDTPSAVQNGVTENSSQCEERNRAVKDVPVHVKVCIVGGGAAGLAVAQKLTEAGEKSLLVLEAQEELGGRIHTFRHGDHLIELGAHWMHGEERNVVAHIAKFINEADKTITLTQTGLGDNRVFIKEGGKVIDPAIWKACLAALVKIEKESEDALRRYQGSFGDFLHEEFQKVNKWGELGYDILATFEKYQNFHNACDSLDQLGARGFLEYKGEEDPGNPFLNWKNGFSTLIDFLKEKVPASKIWTNSPVVSVEWGTATPSSPSCCRIRLESGRIIEADHVVYTPSLGVLKATHLQTFTPQLPMKKAQAIEGLCLGLVNKIFIEFPYRWWPSDCDGFTIVPDINIRRTPITPENWHEHLMGFYSTHRQPRMMCIWIGGECARAMEVLSEEAIAKRCIFVLRKYLGETYTVPDPVFCKRSKWGSNKWTRGSYSFRSIKTDSMNVWAEDLSEPVTNIQGKPLLCFAGEATSTEFYSTVHGAVESGWREAERILKYIKSMPYPPSSRQTTTREKYKVIIVGCGASGIGAARELTAKGINSVLILEANDRVGGRVNTIRTPPQGVVELGAQWIHGEEGNVIYQYAKPRGLIHHKVSVDGKGEFYMESGKLIPEDIVKEVVDLLNEADSDCQEFAHKEIAAPPELSVGRVFREKFLQYMNDSETDHPDRRELKKAMYHWVLRWQRIDNACNSIKELSANCWGNYIFCDGNENMNPKAGYISVLGSILEESRVDLRLNTEVSSINYATEVVVKNGSLFRPDGCTLPVVVKCRDGREFEAEHVMVTPSIGYLKAHLKLFSPPLPRGLQKAITSTGFGTIDKMFLEYEQPWWPKDCEGIQIVWTKDIPDFDNVMQSSQLVDGTVEEMKQFWVRAISGFDPVFNQKAMLCGWIGGAEAEYMEMLSEREVGEACTQLLRHFLGRSDIPNPKRVFRSQWASDPFFRGSYCYHSLGCECLKEDKKENHLNSPVCAVMKDDGQKVPVLVLAGEANSKCYYSTVHGALQSGMKQISHYIQSTTRLQKDQSLIRSKI